MPKADFTHVLQEISRIWREERHKVDANASALKEAVMEGLDRIIREHPFFAGLDARFIDLVCGCARNVRQPSSCAATTRTCAWRSSAARVGTAAHSWRTAAIARQPATAWQAAIPWPSSGPCRASICWA